MAILLLRPAPTIEQSCLQFEAAGLDVVGLATVDIAFCDEEINRLEQHLATDSDAQVIVTSQYAAHAVNQLGDNCILSHPVIAVGSKTAEALPKAESMRIPEQQNSEGIIRMLESTRTSSPVYLIKGDGGRTAIADWCASNGIQLDIFNVYRRISLTPPVSTRQWKAEEIQCIIATSGEQLELTYNEYEADWLNRIPWVVASDRIANIAQQYGSRNVLTSTDASDQSLIQAAKKILE